MKNVLSTIAMLVVLGLVGFGGWHLYSNLFAGPKKQRPLNADVEIPGMLAADKQEAIWEAEHMTFEVEHRLGKAFLKAWVDRDVKKLTSLFQAEFQAGIPSSDQWKVVSKPPLHEKVRLTEEESQLDTDNFDEFLSLLLDPISGVKIDKQKLRILKIVKESDNRWLCRFLLSGSGANEESKSVQFETEADVLVVVDDEKKLGEDASILSWEFRSETIRKSDAPIMQEVTSELQLDEVDLVDNWNLGDGLTQQHNFQIAVEDFDLDGDLDIAVMSANTTRALLAYDDGKYVNVTEQMGIPNVEKDPFGEHIFATAWINIDNDGYPDLISGHKVFKNEQGKQFTDITDQTYLKFDAETMGYNVVDYNNDGFLDLYVLYQRPFGLSAKNVDGSREETDPTSKWINELDSGKFNQLFKNNGDGSFSDVTELTSASGGKRHTHAAVWFFYDDDIYPDIYIANDFGRNVLLQNKGGQYFEDVSDQSGAGGFATSMGVVAGDVDNDGNSDLYVSNMFSEAGRRIIQLVSGDDYSPETYEQLIESCAGNQLFCRANSQMKFEDLSEKAGVKEVGWAWAPTLMDLDSDGWLDLYSTSGLMSFDDQKPDGGTWLWRAVVTQPEDRTIKLPEIGEVDLEAGESWVSNPIQMPMIGVELPVVGENLSSFERNKLFLNVDGERFVDSSFASSADIDSDSRSVVAADIDRDGAVDLLVASVGGGSLRVFSNRLKQGNRIEIRLMGVKSNRFGIGSRIVAECGDRKIVRDLFPQNGFMGIGPALAWIGIGDAPKIDRLTVRWPTGETQEFLDVEVNRSVQIEEGADEIETLKKWN